MLEKQWLYDEIDMLRDEIPEDEQKEIAERIVDTLRGHRLTFFQAYGILRVAKATLEAMAQGLSL